MIFSTMNMIFMKRNSVVFLVHFSNKHQNFMFRSSRTIKKMKANNSIGKIIKVTLNFDNEQNIYGKRKLIC